MDSREVFCPNPACPASGQCEQGTIRVHGQKTLRYRCTVCGRTFTPSRGTALYRLHCPLPMFVQVVTLLAYGCPPAAIVAAFGLDARTVAAWQQRAGAHGERVQQALVEQPHALTHVQADEVRIKRQGGIVWLAMALAVNSRLWLGAVVRVQRDGALAAALAHLVRRCCVAGEQLVWSVDGWTPYVRAVQYIFRDPQPTGRRGRPRLRRWPKLALAQVIKHTTKRRRLVGITRRVVFGSAEQVAACFGAGVITTAWMERLNGTFRARLCALVRRGRAVARQTATLHGAAYLTGTVYNFCTPHGTLSFQAHRPTTPAMAAGLTDHCWSPQELLGWRVPPPRWQPTRHRGRRSKREHALIARWCA
ncbi:MAG: IS1 family transposase [Ktedonobacterales bacterium]|nr:IS1 family transposase [Ktedonobacterales bacterium]